MGAFPFFWTTSTAQYCNFWGFCWYFHIQKLSGAKPFDGLPLEFKKNQTLLSKAVWKRSKMECAAAKSALHVPRLHLCGWTKSVLFHSTEGRGCVHRQEQDPEWSAGGMSGIRSPPLAALCVDDVTRVRNENIHTSELTSQNQHRPVFVVEPTLEEISSVVEHNPTAEISGPGAKT